MRKIILLLLLILASPSLHASAFFLEDFIPKDLESLRLAIRTSYNDEKGSFNWEGRKWFVSRKGYEVFASEHKKKALKVYELTPLLVEYSKYWFLKKGFKGKFFYCPSEQENPKTHSKLSIWYNLELGSLYWGKFRTNLPIKLTTYFPLSP